MADSDSILQRLASGLLEAFNDARGREDSRGKAQEKSAQRAVRWAGLVRDPDFLRTNAWRAAHLSRSAEPANEVREKLDAAIDVANRLADPSAKDSARIFGRVESPEAGGEADLIDAEGCLIAASPIDALGGFAIVTPATGEEVRLEIRDAKGQRAVLDGRTLALTPGLELRRDFATGRCGKVNPVERETPPQRTEMPVLVGKQLKKARAELAKLGDFRVFEDRRPDASERKDVVTGQIPAAREVLDEGTLVLLMVSDGAEKPQEMPELVNKSEAEALKALAGLTYRSVRFAQKVDPKKAGKVVEQDPAPGEELAPSTNITLCLATKTLLMPRVIGLTRKQALEILVPAYIEAPKIDEMPHDGASDVVIEQDPKAGEAIEKGVSLTISIAAPSPDEGRRMPDVLQMTRQEALKLLVPDLAKSIDFAERPQRGRPGIVVAQRPDPGTPDPRDILLTISVSPEKEPDRAMPEVRGKPTNVARKMLKPITDEVKVIERAAKAAPGTVLDQRPARGKPVSEGATLIVAVLPKRKVDKQDDTNKAAATKGTAAKRKPGSVKMPDVIGLTLAKARKAVTDAGLAEPEFDSAEARKRGHRVVEQTPAAGKSVTPKDVIAFEFAKTEKDESS